MSSNNHKFPEAETSDMIQAFVYEEEEVKDWFSRCIEDAPTPRNDKLFSERYMMFGIEMFKWYHRWFTQFKELY